MPSITTKTKKNSTSKYYYYSHSYRVKVDPRADGKGRGSGKSRVITEEVYLGNAEDVLRKCQASLEPQAIQQKSFALECAPLAVAQDLDLVGIIDRHVNKRDQGVSIGTYLVIAAINRLAKPTSRSGIADWFEKTVLPEKLHVDPGLLHSKNFWDAFDKVLPEKDHHPALESDVIRGIEKDIWEQLLSRYQVHLDPILYDTTNFFTFIDPLTPGELAKFAKSKDGKKNRRCVGLGLGLSSFDGFPLFHLVYSANKHDSRLFPTAIRDLCQRFGDMCRTVKGATLVMDKGNNSLDNIQLAAKERITVVGSLVPSQNQDLLHKDLKSYRDEVLGCPVYREEREVFGIPGVVAVTFNANLQKRQQLRLKERLAKAELAVAEAFARFKDKDSKAAMEKRLQNILKGSGVRSCFRLEIGGRRHKTLQFRQDARKIREKKLAAGKTILFSTDPGMRSRELVTLYRSRGKVEATFRLAKDPHGVPFRPMHCWTDSKIRVYAFICVLALLIWRVMQYKLRQVGLKMSDGVLRKELEDLKEIVLMYSPGRVVRKISELSTVQKELVAALGLHRYFPKG